MILIKLFKLLSFSENYLQKITIQLLTKDVDLELQLEQFKRLIEQ